MTPQKKLRCAIYTRKSSDEGLEQSFNSLHAQREACEAYIKSQAHEGWRCIKTAYDDGGISGGTIERPGLKQLLADIQAGLVDVVVVYKVDRLTRSLGDFAKIVDTFDRNEVSFVSITQAFNTTTSMGRLTLNILLSFAQFEREVTSERIRDKIAQSKARGMWMGGRAPLGYDLPPKDGERALRINETEATQVNEIFERYLVLGSVHVLAQDLHRTGVRSKPWRTAKGIEMGGAVMSRGQLFHMLRNRTYLGEVPHKGAWHPGLHPPILTVDLFERVQTALASRALRVESKRLAPPIRPLTGLLFDDAGNPMSPTFTRKRGSAQSYCYYVSSPLLQGKARAEDTDAIRRAPASALEEFISAEVHRRVLSVKPGPPGWDRVRAALVRAELHASTIQLALRSDRLPKMIAARLDPFTREDPTVVRVSLPIRFKPRGGRAWIDAPKGMPSVIRRRVDPILVKGLRSAHSLMREIGGSLYGSPRIGGALDCPDNKYRRQVLALAMLAPDIQEAILEGRQPIDLTMERLIKMQIPTAWPDQRRALGFDDPIAVTTA